MIHYTDILCTLYRCTVPSIGQIKPVWSFSFLSCTPERLSCCCTASSRSIEDQQHAEHRGHEEHKQLCHAISITVSDQLHMPLIIIAGYPCCGKSTFCVRLASYLEAQGVKKVIIINEETENINKRSAYLESSAEKKTRGSLKSAVDHVLDAESFVILDSMNYIKGYRYELFCISRSLRTPHCCIWVESDEDSATTWNDLRNQANVDGGYDAETYVASSKIQSFIHFISQPLQAITSHHFDILIACQQQTSLSLLMNFLISRLLELRRRFEAPIEKNRWDFPLFRVFSKPITLPATNDCAPTSPSKCAALATINILDSNIPTLEKPKVSIGTSTSRNGGDCLIQPLTSTRGQIDINCLAIDGTARTDYHADESIEQPVNVKTSSWRPKVRTTDSSIISRPFTTLEKESNPARSVDVAFKDSPAASSALTISGSVPSVKLDENEDCLDVVMQRVYLHLMNVSHIAAPNSSTISVPRVHADLLHELDRTSQNITQRIITHQTDNVEGKCVYNMLSFMIFTSCAMKIKFYFSTRNTACFSRLRSYPCTPPPCWTCGTPTT